MIHGFTVDLLTHLMPSKRLYLLKQKLHEKAADLLQWVRTPSGQQALQELLLTKVKTESSTSGFPVKILFKRLKLRFLDLSIYFYGFLEE